MIADSYFGKALEFDIQGEIKKAIEYYKLSIENNEDIEEAYSNLIVLLIDITCDYGVTLDLISKGIYAEKDIVEFCYFLERLIIDAENKFKNTNEFVFWKYYHNNYFTEFERNQFLEIIELNDKILVPYLGLYIYDVPNSIPVNHYLDKINKLKGIVNNLNTIKNRYIKSLIDSCEFHSKISQ